ncbi:hypothetical protein ACFWCF_12590 [Rhodococcus sp. NPDC060090]|uniref:hypothetical protein n=1 Tax=Rhodococcus sp. NPDC060090 TaxID=3347056 RepID=UPI00364A108A
MVVAIVILRFVTARIAQGEDLIKHGIGGEEFISAGKRAGDHRPDELDTDVGPVRVVDIEGEFGGVLEPAPLFHSSGLLLSVFGGAGVGPPHQKGAGSGRNHCQDAEDDLDCRHRASIASTTTRRGVGSLGTG